MFHFFVPANKVQKDRQLMRDTDARVAKYSRRGLIFNFIVFVLCLAFGDFLTEETNLSIILVTGLLLVTLLRNYYLFRFDTLYARAPGRWRNQYFVASCLGAAWWSFILVSLTAKLGMRDETLVMWLYSVVFYSSVSSVFAPYHRFLKIYLFIGLIPTSITAMFLGDINGYLYGFIMITFYLMLIHQGKITSIAYWERLEASYLLQEHAKGLEHDQRSSQQASKIKNEFLVNLGQEFRSSIGDILGTLTLIDDSKLSERHRELLSMASKAGERQLDLVNNVVDFSRITTRTLNLEAIDFDLRRMLEKLIQDFALDAHQQGVELYYHFDQDLPERVRGDLSRLGQILSTLLNHALKNATIDHVFVEANFNTLRDSDDIGQLQVVISDNEQSHNGTNGGDEEKLNQGSTDDRHVGIGLSICKGLAACMDGSVNLIENKQRGNQIFINVRLSVISHDIKPFGTEKKLRGKHALLIDLPESVALTISEQITQWGMKTTIQTGFDTAMRHIKEAHAKSPLDVILIYTRLNSMAGLALSAEIAMHPDYKNIKQIIAMSMVQSDTPATQAHLQQYPHISLIEKPIMRRRLYDALLHHVLNVTEEDDSLAARESNALLTQPKVLLVEPQRVDQMVISAMIRKIGFYVQVVADGQEAVDILEKEKFHLVLMDFEVQLQNSLTAVKTIREREREQHVLQPIPIVAVTGGNIDDNQIHYLEGMNDQISKPVRHDELAEKLKRWI